MIKPKPPGSERLESFADRIDRLEEERKAIGADVKDVYTEVDKAGYNTKALRKVLAERRKKTDAELEAEIDRYRVALGMPGATYRSVAEDLGVPKSTLHRLVPVASRGTRPMVDADLGEWLPSHDLETGELPREMTGDDLGTFEGVHTEHTLGRPMTADDLGDPLLVTDKERGRFRDKVRTLAAGIKPVAVEAVKVDTRAFDEIVGDMPAHLRRIA
jgi:uncharacterized protein (UPF0335 family)